MSTLPKMRTSRRQASAGYRRQRPSDSPEGARRGCKESTRRSPSESPDRHGRRRGAESYRSLESPCSAQPRQPSRQPTRLPSQTIRSNQPTPTDDSQPTCNRQTARSTVRRCRSVRSPSVDVISARLAEREEYSRFPMDGSDDTPRRLEATSRREYLESPPVNRMHRRQFRSAEELFSPEVQQRRGGVMAMMEPFKADINVKGFMQRFEDLRILYGWTELEQKVQLRQAMRGPAEHILNELSYDLCVTDMLNLIRRRFGRADQQERHRTELQKLKQGKMSLEQLHYRVRELMVKAYPNAVGLLAETIARDAFINALESDEVKLRIRTARFQGQLIGATKVDVVGKNHVEGSAYVQLSPRSHLWTCLRAL